jgi:hypothetical protein
MFITFFSFFLLFRESSIFYIYHFFFFFYSRKEFRILDYPVIIFIKIIFIYLKRIL